jgi:hypothetical protein
MKTQTINNITKKLFLGGILSTVIFLSVQSKTFAASNFNDSTIKETMAAKVSVKYIGNSEDGLFFNVKYNNEKGKYFDVVIKDESGETLYSGNFNDKSFDKKFLLPKDHEVSSISIAVNAGKNNFVQNYNVTVKSNTYTDVVVSKN